IEAEYLDVVEPLEACEILDDARIAREHGADFLAFVGVAQLLPSRLAQVLRPAVGCGQVDVGHRLVSRDPDVLGDARGEVLVGEDVSDRVRPRLGRGRPTWRGSALARRNVIGRGTGILA